MLQVLTGDASMLRVLIATPRRNHWKVFKANVFTIHDSGALTLSQCDAEPITPDSPMQFVAAYAPGYWLEVCSLEVRNAEAEEGPDLNE